jgi:serine/threonine-protein kinase
MLAPHALQPGSQLGQYRLLRFLGEGGFAEVWLGRREGEAPGDPVAIKLVRRGRFGNAEHRALLIGEAKIAARIRHPNVAHVFEIDEDQGMPYLVMEYVAGGSLETLARGASAMGEPIPVGVAVRLVADVCAGLHAAHELTIDGRAQHLVHRDISPQNVLVTEAGTPKLIDFGIAKARERVSKRTSTGIAKGKVAYMSPEQARGEELDRRSDLWSVGAMAYELLEARPLLPGTNDVARLRMLVNSSLRPVFVRTPDHLVPVLRKALAFRARDRHETAEELRLDLERALLADGQQPSQVAIAEFCARARAAADAAASVDSAADDLRAFLPAATAGVTVSTVSPSPHAARRQRILAWLAAGTAASILAVVAIRLGTGTRAPAALAAPAVASSSVATPSGRVATPAPATSPALPEGTALGGSPASAASLATGTSTAVGLARPHPQTPARPPVAAPSRTRSSPPRGAARSKDDDRID